jgi:hypothetical protein
MTTNNNGMYLQTPNGRPSWTGESTELKEVLEARAGIEPAHKGFADHEEAANNPSILFDCGLLSFLAVRLWSALSFHQSVNGLRSRHVQLTNAGRSTLAEP